MSADWRLQTTADGSPSLFSLRFSEAFHSDRGAYREAVETYGRPAELERFKGGQVLTVLDVGVGLGYNSACLLEACADRGLRVNWWGLELDPEPLAHVLSDPSYRRLWRPTTLAVLEQLREGGAAGSRSVWSHAAGAGELLWGDARQRIPALLENQAGCFDLVLLDAFSPRRCPELWSLEFLGSLSRLLGPEGRLITYCAAAAVRASLAAAGLELASLTVSRLDASDRWGERWSQGTVASPSALPASEHFRPLHPMECEHLTTRAAEPYRDPDGRTDAATILARRAQAQQHSQALSTTAWRARWQGRGRDSGDEG
ncbi:MAG: MnmC family methyltransferase [Cyanobacteriota bacterium]